MAQALFIFDFDLTISRQHIHNLLANAIAAGLFAANDRLAQWHYVKNVAPTGSVEKWQNLFAQLNNHHRQVAIASFSDYKPIVERYLREKLNLDEKLLNEIYIESWLPRDPNSADKSQHIENIIQHFAFKGKPEEIVLIDDAKINCQSARKKHYQVIEVRRGDKAAAHIDAVIQLDNSMK